MKNTILSILIAVFLFIVLQGFQCGSTEMTSAKLYIQRNDWRGAEVALAREAAKNPKNAEAQYFLGFARLQLAKFPDALIALNQSLEASNEFASKIKDAKHFGWAQTLNLGVTQYNASISASKDSAPMLRAKAIESYKTSIAFEPDSLVSYNRLAIAQSANSDYDGEISTIKEALKKKKDPELYRMLINTYSLMAEEAEGKGNKKVADENYNNALMQLTDARKVDPENEDLLRIMIDLYIRVGKANDAKPAMREALQKDPKNKLYNYNLGALLMQGDSLEQAVKHFEAAIAVDSVYEVALRNCSLAYMKIGEKIKQSTADSKKDSKDNKTYVAKFKQAVVLLERLTAMKNDDPNLWDALATAYGNAGMFKEATKAINKADSLRKK